MKIYDISQEVFSCAVYDGDPKPERKIISSIENGDLYNLTAFSMCAHNGTHIDAPSHFLNSKTIDEIPLDSFIGYCYVTEANGLLGKEDAQRIIDDAKNSSKDSASRILIKGEAVVTLEAAKLFKKAKIKLLGVESQTVGPTDAPMAVHLELLGAETVLLEGLRLGSISAGVYFLNAAPLNLKGSDGSPCRAILIEF